MTFSLFDRIKKNKNNFSLLLVLPVLFLMLALEFNGFFPTLGEINIWDEANYIQSGYQLLTQGALPQLGGSPLSSLLYGLTMLPALASPNFFVLSIAIGRIILYLLIFLSSYLIAKEMKPLANPWVMLGLLLIVPVASVMYLYPSDILFAGLAGLSFGQMLAFYHTRNEKHLWWASAFMGLAALARAEGLLLFSVLVVVTLVMVLPDKEWFRSVLPIALPFALLVGGYILGYGLVTGDFDTGLAWRTYNNFESGQEVIYSQTGIFTPTISARLEAREAFGTPEENDNSVFKAIKRNPQVYWQRLSLMGSVFLEMATKAYGNKFLLILVWLSLRGFIALIQKKRYPLALMSILWFVPWGAGLLNTFFREGYFMMPFFVIFFLTSIGLTAIIENFDLKWERVGLLIGSVSILTLSALLKNTSMLYRNSLFIVGLGFIFLLWVGRQTKARWQHMAFWIILVVALLMRGGYPSPDWPVYGYTDVERSVYVLQESFSPGSGILAGAPANIWAARMRYFGINSYDIPDFPDATAFHLWLTNQEIAGVYVDLHFPDYYLVYVEALAGKQLNEIFATPERDILIYQVKDTIND